LGAAFAEALARRGLNVVLLARQEEALKATAARLKDTYGVDVVAFAADVADFEGVKKRLGDLNLPIGLLV
jgi:short-subunit dehydrogenase